MKKIFIFISFISFSALAADLNLNGGESAVIRANVETRVTCGGSSSGGTVSCPEAVEYFRKLMNACMQSSTTSYCLDRNWAKFKQTSPNCVPLAFDQCMEYCLQTSTNSYCIDKCQ